MKGTVVKLYIVTFMFVFPVKSIALSSYRSERIFADLTPAFMLNPVLKSAFALSIQAAAWYKGLMM